MLAIYKKEWKQYFNSMIGFVFLAFFLAIIGIYTWACNFANGLGNFEITLSSVCFLYVILIPILTMRIVAEEHHQKTDQLLYTAPVSLTKIVVGKYLAVLSLFAIGILVIAIYPLILKFYGTEVRLSLAYSSLIGFFLLGAAYIAIGMFLSSLTESQVIAAVVSFITMLLTFLMTSLTGLLPTGKLYQYLIVVVIWLVMALITYSMMHNMTFTIVFAGIGEIAFLLLYFLKGSVYDSLMTNILNGLAISSHFDDFSLGILEYDAIVYYSSIAFLFVFLTIQMIKKRRFS